MKKNILILTMSLNIGGAETHIFELANELAARGNRVTVFSAGGVYADKLKENGIEHINVPLNRKSPAALLRSYRVVAEYVREHRQCVIHSHTRISNFTARAVAARYRVPFVSTVHFNFSTGFTQRLFTSWGDRALAVSEDLKEYAAREYGFEREKITVTVNGINLNTFRKADCPELRAELGIPEDAKVILCVSRLDEVAGDHVQRVLDMAERIYRSNPDSRIVIVGGGTRYKNFCAAAKQINEKTASGFITLTGPQTDIYRFCNIAQLFIGISRSALEAMACRVPVILLGNSGYLGLYSEKTHDACIDTNFTCRGCPYPDDGETVELITDMLKHPESYTENVNAAYETVKNRYSVSKMAIDAENSYLAAQKDLRPIDFMLCGYYGRHNLGDDMTLKAFTDNTRRTCGSDNTVLLSADRKAPECDGISKVIHRFNLAKIFKHMKKTNVFVLGGGSILQDVTSSRSMLYYTYIAKKAKKYGCKLMLYSNGVGPITKKHNRSRAAEVLNLADTITVRDRRSMVYMRALGVTNSNIFLTSDDTFTLDRDSLISPYDGLTDGKYLCVNLRVSDFKKSFLKSLCELLNYAYDKYGYIPVLLPVQYSNDLPMLKDMSKQLKCRNILIDRQLPHSQTLDILRKCNTTIMERLHGVIFSSIYGKPFLALNYDPKVFSFCIDMGLEDYIINMNSSDTEKLITQFDKMEKSRPELVEILKDKVKEKQQLAQKNAEHAAQLLKG